MSQSGMSLARQRSAPVAASYSATQGLPLQITADGVVGAQTVAEAPPDGYTLLVTSSSFVVNPSFHKKLPFDVVKSFAPISLVGIAPLVMTANNDLPAKDIKELINRSNAEVQDGVDLVALAAAWTITGAAFLGVLAAHRGLPSSLVPHAPPSGRDQVVAAGGRRIAAILVCAGDPDQAVLTFRGADPRGMEAIEAETVVPLSCQRCLTPVEVGLRRDRHGHLVADLQAMRTAELLAVEKQATQAPQLVDRAPEGTTPPAIAADRDVIVVHLTGQFAVFIGDAT